jgi:hypothetical protein
MRLAISSSAVAAGVMLSCALLQPRAARAQDVSVMAGLSSATIAFSPESGSPGLPGGTRRSGLVGGVSFLLPTGDRGGYQIDVLVHQKGARDLLRRDDAIRLTYLEVPALLHVGVGKLRNGAVYLVAGPTLAFTLRASYNDNGETEDIRNDIETFDLGLSVGGGVELGRVTLGARYTWGLRSAFQDGDSPGAFKNRTGAVTAGFRFWR